jgi:mxaA protein
LAAAIGAYLGYLYGYFPYWPRKQIFKKAEKQLGKLSAGELDQAVIILHHALNTLYGQPLFKKQLSTFYQQQPHYLTAADALQQFFNLSERVLYAASVPQDAQALAAVQQLCRLCVEIERGRR